MHHLYSNIILGSLPLTLCKLIFEHGVVEIAFLGVYARFWAKDFRVWDSGVFHYLVRHLSICWFLWRRLLRLICGAYKSIVLHTKHLWHRLVSLVTRRLNSLFSLGTLVKRYVVEVIVVGPLSRLLIHAVLITSPRLCTLIHVILILGNTKMLLILLIQFLGCQKVLFITEFFRRWYLVCHQNLFQVIEFSWVFIATLVTQEYEDVLVVVSEL